MIARAVEPVVIDIGAAAAGHGVHQQHAEGPAVAVGARHGQHRHLSLGDRLALAHQVGHAATMRESAATATFCAIQAVETVAPDTGAGQRALQILASGTLMVTGLSTPSFQRMSGARMGRRPVNSAPRMPERVQLMKPGACGEDAAHVEGERVALS